MKKKKITKAEFSKQVAKWILIIALIDIQLTYVLAFLGKEIAETLAITLVTEVVAVYGIYCLKAYNGKKREEETRLKEDNDELHDDF